MLDQPIEGIFFETFAVGDTPLKPGGCTINVTDANKAEYVDLKSRWLLAGEVEKQLSGLSAQCLCAHLSFSLLLSDCSTAVAVAVVVVSLLSDCSTAVAVVVSLFHCCCCCLIVALLHCCCCCYCTNSLSLCYCFIVVKHCKASNALYSTLAAP